MKQILLVFSSILVLSLFVKSAELDVIPASDRLILLNTTTTSCRAMITSDDLTNDISAIYFSMPQLQFRWDSNLPLTIQWINVKLSGGQLSYNNEFSATLGGDQLLYSFYGIRTGGRYEATLPNDLGISSNQCSFKFGGINMPDKGKNSDGKAMVTVYGTYNDGSGNLIPVSKQIELKYHYEGTGSKR